LVYCIVFEVQISELLLIFLYPVKFLR